VKLDLTKTFYPLGSSLSRERRSISMYRSLQQTRREKSILWTGGANAQSEATQALPKLRLSLSPNIGTAAVAEFGRGWRSPACLLSAGLSV
jgi:hypothetical protein